MDNQQQQSGGDEYQYSGTQYDAGDYADTASQGAESAPADNQAMSGDKGKRLLIIIGVIVVAIVAYKIISVYMARHQRAKSKAALTVTNHHAAAIPSLAAFSHKQSAPVASPVAAQHSAVPHAQAASHWGQSEHALGQQLNAMEQQGRASASQLEQVSLNLNSMNATISNMTSTIANINANMQRLATKVDVIQHIQARQEKQAVVQQRVEAQQRRVRYYIQALVPGRAWLQGSNGSTLTVRRGDRVPNYGVIEKIDSKLGIVVTSSGKVLRFGIHEN